MVGRLLEREGEGPPSLPSRWAVQPPNSANLVDPQCIGARPDLHTKGSVFRKGDLDLDYSNTHILNVECSVMEVGNMSWI